MYVAFASGSCGWTGVGGGALSLPFVAGMYHYFERSSRAVDVHGGAVSAAVTVGGAVGASSITEAVIHVDTFSRGSKSDWDISCQLFFISRRYNYDIVNLVFVSRVHIFHARTFVAGFYSLASGLKDHGHMAPLLKPAGMI